MEQFSLGGKSPGVTAVARLFGGNALVVGDASGQVSTWFLSRPADESPLTASPVESGDGLRLSLSVDFPNDNTDAITGIAASLRSRLFAVSDASGRVRLMHSTTGRQLVSAATGLPPSAAEGMQPLAIGPRENQLLTATPSGLRAWSFAPGYPDVSLAALFGKVWYENYPEPMHAWETTGHESFEPKYGLVPLVFGTIKATLYSMLFAVPIAILAAIYSSQFMRPEWRARVKPTIEMMASLPSVVLGFIAGLVFAPLL